MSKYIVRTEFSGYSRGDAYHIVEADSEAEAMENWYEGTESDRMVVRDDTEHEPVSVELIEEK